MSTVRDRLPVPPIMPTGTVTTPFAEARVMFSLYDQNRDTYLDGASGEYVEIQSSDGLTTVTDSGDLFRHVAKANGGVSVSMRAYQAFVATFDVNRDGGLDPAEWARYSAFLVSHERMMSGPHT